MENILLGQRANQCMAGGVGAGWVQVTGWWDGLQVLWPGAQDAFCHNAL